MGYYKLVIPRLPNKKHMDRDRVMVHAMFQLLVDFVEKDKGMTFMTLDEIRNWAEIQEGPPPHPFEIMYAGANAFSRFFYWKRWRKVLAQAYMWHEIKELTGPDSTPEESAYAALVQLQQDLYLWYTREYKEAQQTKDGLVITSTSEPPTDATVVDEKLRQLISIRHTLWT